MEKDEILKGLDAFAKLAKQDILKSAVVSDREYWEQNAKARYEKYKELYKNIEEKGIDETLKIAIEEYKLIGESSDAISRGRKRALESFFVLLGIDPSQV